MNKFDDGIKVVHKATKKDCVVMCTNPDGTIKVRTQDDLERDYRPVELETKQEVIDRQQGAAQTEAESNKSKDWSIG